MLIEVLFERALEILKIILADPIIYFPLVGAWMITSIYFLVHPSENHGETYVMSTGITLLFTSYVISPLANPNLFWTTDDPRTMIVLGIFLYGTLLITLGILKKTPQFLENILGDSGHSLVPTLMAILFIEKQIPLDKITLLVLAIPVIILSIFKNYRKIKIRI